MIMNNRRKAAFQFIVLLGIVSLFGDITYEGARSITGPYLAFLGASAGIVGLVAGASEFIGYALRLGSGYLADRTRAYWPITITGYGLLICVPLLAFAGYWQLAAFLIASERMGKAIRTPARDAILSHATEQVGRGWGFGIHEALDQVGALIGPLLFSAVFLFKGGYSEGFSLLWIPALLTLVILLVAKIKVPSPEKLETPHKTLRQGTKGKLPGVFYFYTLFTFLTVAGFVNFPLISYHFKIQSVISNVQIPVFYAIAMGVDALVALIIGRIYDRIGLKVLLTIPLLTFSIPLFGFSQSYNLALIGIILWGAVMGIHETIMRAAIADLTPIIQRGRAYGIFNAVYGASWFCGSVLMGLLYDVSLSWLILFVVAVEVSSVSVFFVAKKEHRLR